MKNKYNNGFTLIELLVVIAIIGILAALVLVALGNARDKAHDVRVRSGIGQLRTLAEVYYNSNGASYLGLDTCYDTPNSTNCVGDIEGSVAAVKADVIDAADTGTFRTGSIADEFCISNSLWSNTNEYFCADASGEFKESNSADCDIPTLTACP